MAPGNNERRPNHTGTIPKTKIRNNCNVPQEVVTPTRRDNATNMVSTSLDWVPVSEYNSRGNHNQSRKPTNNSSDHEFADLEHAASFESGFGRFVPVRPQPRVLPLSVQNCDNLTSERNDDGAGSSLSGHSLHSYGHQNGVIPHSNHAAAAVMIVNPTTPNALTGNVAQPYNVPNQNRNNLTRNLHPARNNFEGSAHSSNNNSTQSLSNSRGGTKTVNLINNMYEQAQGGLSNINENHISRESARVLGEAIVAACPDAAAVERRLGQIREYIRVTSSLVDTMRNSEDEQDIVVRPVSVQSNGSAYSENELWQSEIKNKMELSQLRLTALKQQQKRLLKYQEEAKQQLEDMHRERERESQEIHASTVHDNYANLQGHYPHSSNHYPNRMFAANQIGVATTLPHSSEHISQPVATSNVENDTNRAYPSRSHDEFVRGNNQEIASRDGRAADSEPEEEILSDRARVIQHKLRELQMKKQHVEKLVTEFQKLQRATQMGASLNTYSSSGEESGDEAHIPKSNKPCSNLKNEDPFKLMEIKSIKAALEKTKVLTDLMRTVENYESDRLSGTGHDDFHTTGHSNNIQHDNKSDGCVSGGGWSSVYEDSAPRNRQKFTNENQQSHEANIASLQELAQELRMETEKIMSERTRIKDLVSSKAEGSRRQKKVNEEAAAVPSTSGTSMGPAERRQMQLRALLAEKQRELEALLNKEEVPVPASAMQMAARSASQPASVIHQSYNSEQEEPDSRSEQLLMDAQNSRDIEAFRGGVDSGLGVRSNTIPSHLGSIFGSDSDSASRTKSNQRNRSRRRPVPERQSDDNATQTSSNVNVMRHEPQRPESSNVNMVQPAAVQNNDPNMLPYPYPPQNWNKSNQDIGRNQFTQNSHSQTMERLMGTPQMFAPPAPPSVPFNMMMPYGMVGGCGCGCGVWGAWCWQQLALQQREIHQLREQLNHLEERWRAETASHTLNNQVPPGNRANNYWDNFRSYSRQNLLSANSKTNADGHLGSSVAHNPQPLVERSHNTLHHTTSSSSNTPKRNTDSSQTINEEFPNRQRRNVAYERSHSFSSAPDVLNVNQNAENDASTSTHNRNADENIIPNVNINRQDRNLNISNPIPEIIQSHSNNLKKKSSSKLPAKNSTNRRNYSLGYVETCNINIASTSEAPNPNLASTSRDDKATQKVFDHARDNVYSEVTNLIGANESHPDFLIQLFRELQLISSDSLRHRVLQSIRNVLAQYDLIVDNQSNDISEASRPEVVTTSADSNYHECTSASGQNCTSTVQIDNSIVRFLLLKSEEICTPDLLETLASHILNSTEEVKSPQQLKRLRDLLAKYEGMRVCDVSSDIIDNLPILSSNEDESTQHTSELSDSSILQDVAGSLNLFNSSDTHLHQVNSCPFELWQRHVHDDNEVNNSQDGKVDLINCSEMHNADLAEADQTHSENDPEEGVACVDALPDVVDTEETTPTEAEAEWLGLDRVPTRLQLSDPPAKQKD